MSSSLVNLHASPLAELELFMPIFAVENAYGFMQTRATLVG
jgi:hypothetical protein